jgi:hypothetical protein
MGWCLHRFLFFLWGGRSHTASISYSVKPLNRIPDSSKLI